MIIVVLRSHTALAQDVTLRVGDHDWTAAVSALQSDTQSEGRAVDVTAWFGTTRLSCAHYTLTLDAVSAAAFAVEGCDPTTDATRLRLTNRRGLFSTSDAIPQPLAAGLQVNVSERTDVAGGASGGVASEVQCRASVRPYLPDLLTGSRVYLTPDHFTLRLLSATARADDLRDGWSIQGASGEVTLEYEIVRRTDGAVVLHDHVTLACDRAEGGAVASDAGVATAPPTVAAPAHPASSVAPMVLLGVGVAGVAGSVVLLTLAQSEQSIANAECTSTSTSSCAMRREQASTDETLGFVGLGVAGAVALTGVVLWLGERSATRSSSIATIAPLPDGGVIASFSARF